jgi:L-aspartate oxidase
MQRFLVQPDELKVDEEITSPIVVIGSGVAGLSAAIAASEHTQVTLVTKSWLSDSNTDWAQGGVAVVLAPGDTFSKHISDTLSVGQGLCHEEVVRRVVEGGPAAIRRLIEWGGQFDRSAEGSLSLGLEAGHSADRVVHAMGDGTGREIQRVLVDRARRCPQINLLEHAFAIDLLVQGGRVTGVLVMFGGRMLRIRAGAVICATGGCGQVFRETTNPEVATGDGHAMLFRAGARLRGMEFVQFHPTTLYIAGSSRLLISEAARGEGGILRDCNGHAFMESQDPRAELAPRDLLSRAVLNQMVKTRHTNVYLDLRHLPPAFVRERFPRIYRVCRTFGLDITRDLIPVTPAAHYMIGGAVVDADGRTSLRNLFAIGEVACSGLHGANRLASNSLLEGLVLGDHSGGVAARECELPASAADDGAPSASERREDRDFNSADLSNSLKALMWRHVGIMRSGLELAEAEVRLEAWQRAADRVCRPITRDFELRNLLTLARLITRAARERNESRGVHYRTDRPGRDDDLWHSNLEIHRTPAGEIESARAAVPPQTATARVEAPGAAPDPKGRRTEAHR